MIAQPAFARRTPSPRAVRHATQRRIARGSRKRYAPISQVFVWLGWGLFFLMAYVMLTANLTRMTYAVGKVQHQRSILKEQTGRLDDRLSALRSEERLSAAAAKLGMRDPSLFAVVHVAPAPYQDRSHVALLSTLP
jgi:hypothetical protein